MHDELIKHAEITSEGLIVTFNDGREGVIGDEDLLSCVEATGGFEKLAALQKSMAQDESSGGLPPTAQVSPDGGQQSPSDADVTSKK